MTNKNDELLSMDKAFHRESDSLKRHVSHLKYILPIGIIKTNAHGQVVWENEQAGTLIRFNNQIKPILDEHRHDNQLFLSYFPFVQSEIQGKREFIIETPKHLLLSVKLIITYQQSQCFNYWFFEDITLKEKTNQLIKHYNILMNVKNIFSFSIYHIME